MTLLRALLAAAALAATTLVDVRVYPIPWKPGSGDAAFDTPAVTFDRLPPACEATIFTLRGQKVWKGVANGAGVLTWNGLNEAGRSVGSGTYLVLFNGGGTKTTRRVVVVR
ncbi:MAG: T9SS type A sorting domain-containing protein [Elusimicrobia bacterium]|nr:T9SS type A sorting domain-containing protein [Elusimicrobiota bacterium]